MYVHPKTFKNRMKLGGGITFDKDGFPTAEDDPIIEAARRKSKVYDESCSGRGRVRRAENVELSADMEMNRFD